MSVAHETSPAKPTERRAHLMYSAGERTWDVSVPLMGDSVDAAVVAMAAAFKLLARRVRPAWVAEVNRGRPTRRRATRRRVA